MEDKRILTQRDKLVGTIWPTNFSGNVKVEEYRDTYHVLVTFLNTNNKRWVRFSNLKFGKIVDKTQPSVYGVGYMGIGSYNSNNYSYSVWLNMLQRCCASNEKINPTYQECEVCDEWLNYQNFAKWYSKHALCENGHLDKDILIKNNKIYSPKTCCVVPQVINEIFVKNNKRRGKLPIGVSRASNNIHLYIARCRVPHSTKDYIGVFDTPQSAFVAYKAKKEKVIQLYAQKYKDQIESKVYKALMNYQVDITD